jgi:hypothetical protein
MFKKILIGILFILFVSSSYGVTPLLSQPPPPPLSPSCSCFYAPLKLDTIKTLPSLTNIQNTAAKIFTTNYNTAPGTLVGL